MKHSIRDFQDVGRLSKWAPAALSILEKHMACDPAHDEQHIVRVVRNAIKFSPHGDRDVVVVAAILHDIVNAPKDDFELRRTASRKSADIACHELDQLIEWGPVIRREMVHNAIEAHSYSANVRCRFLEAAAVQDADRIDALGYVGISRLFSVTGALGRAIAHPTDPLCDTQRPNEEEKYAVDHFFKKLINLPVKMQTPEGKIEAKRRVDIMRAFFNGLSGELSG